MRRRNQALPTAPQPPPRYNPAIYSYMCRGAYHASSDAKEGGVCNGFKSQLAVLYDERQESLTRAEALKRFTDSNAEFDFDPQQDQADALEDEYGGLHGKAQAVFISPALIYRDKDANNKSMEEDGNGSDDKDAKSKKHPLVVNPILQNQETLPEEELIKRQEWHCYGSTEVEYLVLQDPKTGEKKIAAVAPHNTGISRRTIETDDSVRSITRIGLGWLDIIHDNNAIVSDQDQNSRDTDGEDRKATNDDDASAEPTTPTTMTPVEVYATAKEGLQRTYDFSWKVGEHMKMNAGWLADNLRDDFPRRTYQAGQKIVKQLPATAEQTAGSMIKIVGFLLGDWDDDHDDDDDDSDPRRN